MSLPDCYGKLWQQNEPECAGGRDPNYTSPSGTHIRERCEFFNSCGSRKQAVAQDKDAYSSGGSIFSQPLISPNSLVRNGQNYNSYRGYNSYGQPAQRSTQVDELERQLQQARAVIQQQNQALHQGQRVPISTPGTYQSPQMMAMDMSIPKYLTAPEPLEEGQSVWNILGREVLRGVMKAAGHTMASFWDRTPIGSRDDKRSK